uniref:Cadherin domain-containing protein n=1 Tax=Hippocampus comes TaxID=109280 RepID=A0A3Q3E0C4_HIPCM
MQSGLSELFIISRRNGRCWKRLFIHFVAFKGLTIKMTRGCSKLVETRPLVILLFLCTLVDPTSSVTHYSIPEEMDEGSVVANLASDLGLDVRTLNKRKMRIDVVANKKYLDINKDTGELFILERIDGEVLCTFKTTAYCSLKLDATIENPIRIIIVRVLDVNDNAPSFDKDKYLVEVMENSPIGSLVIQLNATDLDEGSNSDVLYSYSLYTSERTQNVFTLNQENDATLRCSSVFE